MNANAEKSIERARNMADHLRPSDDGWPNLSEIDAKVIADLLDEYADRLEADEWGKQFSPLYLPQPKQSPVVDEYPDFVEWARKYFNEDAEEFNEESAVQISIASLKNLALTAWQASAKLRQAVVPDGWQPIETAPRDGTAILLAKIGPTKGVPELDIAPREIYVWRVSKGFWHENYQNWNDGFEPSGLSKPKLVMMATALAQHEALIFSGQAEVETDPGWVHEHRKKLAQLKRERKRLHMQGIHK